jgi:hypothetical protein
MVMAQADAVVIGGNGLSPPGTVMSGGYFLV